APRGSAGLRAWLLLGVAAAAVIAAALYLLLSGRDVLGNSLAALDLAKLSGRVPGWALVAAPALAAAVLVAVAVYVALGRHLALKLLAVGVVVVALAAPGLALGWANSTVATVSHRSAEVEAVVAKTQEQLRPRLPGEPMNILLIGSDRTDLPGDPGRSDTQMLVRLDPATRSISMLSVPRDLRVMIPDRGYDKMNTAYSYGGPALTVRTFMELTGLEINHFVEIDFAGFWHTVNVLGGVYIPVDHRYYNPESSDYKSIDIKPGYQLLDGHDSLDLVRFRHDQRGDFTRMERQQLFLKELQRQSGRWSKDWAKVLRLIKAITAETTSDIDSLKRLKPLVELIFQVDTSKVSSVHLEGSTPMIAGVSYVEATQAEIDAAVEEFTHPTRAPVKSAGVRITKKMYGVRVYNGSGIAGKSATAADQLAALGYAVTVGPDAPEFPGTVTLVYAPPGLATQAEELAAMFTPSDVVLVDRAPGGSGGISVFVTSSFGGTLILPEKTVEPQQTLEQDVRYDAAAWAESATKTPLPLEMPTAWSPGFSYDEFRTYRIKTPTGTSAAAVAVARTPSGGYWSIQTLHWARPPAITDPDAAKTVKGTKYLLFYEGDRLHMVAWSRNGTLYWVLNTLDDEISSDVLLGLATSFAPVE
ncbi:MAG: LCP family protein, partial [Thermoleophilia bacterium]